MKKKLFVIFISLGSTAAVFGAEHPTNTTIPMNNEILRPCYHYLIPRSERERVRLALRIRHLKNAFQILVRDYSAWDMDACTATRNKILNDASENGGEVDAEIDFGTPPFISRLKIDDTAFTSRFP